MKYFLKNLQDKPGVTLGFVGGSDLAKQQEQLGKDAMQYFDYWFPENGLVAYRKGNLFHTQSLKNHLGEEKLQQLTNFMLHYIADLKIPKKRGTFVEFRNGLLNISPIGRNCSQEERNEFERYDREQNVRKQFVHVLQKRFNEELGFQMRFSIGGQISFDVFPEGWDKTYCLRHIQEERFDVIHFFGDKTQPGENDYEIFVNKTVIGHAVTGPSNTIAQVNEVLATKPSPVAKQ